MSSGNPKLSKPTAEFEAELSAGSLFVFDIDLFSSAWLFARVASPRARHFYRRGMRPGVAFVNEW